MTWPATLELTLDGMAQGGEAVGRWEGRVVFAAGGLPGEQVRVSLTESRPSYAHAAVTEVIEPSADRVAPRLPGADHMPWQHIAYEAQLRFKRQILAEQLSKIGGLADVEVGPTAAASPPWGYRSGAQVHIDGIDLGYHRAGSRELQPLEADPLLQAPLNAALATLRAALGAKDRATGAVLRLSEAHGYLVAALRGSGDLRPLALRWRAGEPRLSGVVLPEPPSAGADHLLEELDGLAFRLRPTTFFQVNVAAAGTLLRLVREGLRLEGGERLLDLYCGAGTFALPLARAAAEVVGVEEHAGAVADGEASAQLNGIGNVRFTTSRVETALARLDPGFDAAVLDPPRRGCHPSALDELLRLAPPTILYVSCHPGTLARDLKTLVAGGYRLASVTPVDLFPQTPHIESVAVLTRDGRSM